MNKRFQIAIIAIMASVIFHACRMGKDYQRPELNLPETYRDQGLAADSAGIGSIHWKDFFRDSLLRNIIDTALVYNHDMRKAYTNIRIADQQVRQGRAQYLPEVDATIASMSRQFRSENFYSGPTAKYYAQTGKTAPDNMYTYTPQNSSSISLSWELDIWGKISRQNEATFARYLETDEARKLLQTQLIANIAEGYYNLLMLDAQLVVAQRNLQLSDSTLRMVKLQRDAGQLTSLAIQQTESQQLEAASLVPQLKKQIVVQENSIQVLAGRYPDSVRRAAAVKDFIADSVSSGIPLYMVGNRPDVRAAELELRAVNAEVGVAQAYRYPTLTIDATGGLNSMLASNWVDVPGSLFGSLLGSITQPVFSRRKLKTRFEIAKLEREKAELDFQQTVLNAVSEISSTLATLENLEEEYKIAARRVQVAQLGTKQAGMLFKAGLATYLEVINAQRNAISSELNLVGVQQQLILARVELYRALGGGWKS